MSLSCTSVYFIACPLPVTRTRCRLGYLGQFLRAHHVRRTNALASADLVGACHDGRWHTLSSLNLSLWHRLDPPVYRTPKLRNPHTQCTCHTSGRMRARPTVTRCVWYRQLRTRDSCYSLHLSSSMLSIRSFASSSFFLMPALTPRLCPHHKPKSKKPILIRIPKRSVHKNRLAISICIVASPHASTLDTLVCVLRPSRVYSIHDDPVPVAVKQPAPPLTSGIPKSKSHSAS